MFETITPQKIIDNAELNTDNDGYDMVTDGQFVEWINDEVSALWLWATRANRDIFTKSVEGQIASGQNYISITAAAPTGLAVTDFMNARGVDLKFGTDDYRRIARFNFNTRDCVAEISFRVIGDQLWINPISNASLYPFRLWYIYSAPVASSSALSTAMSLPLGGGEYVTSGVAAKLRARLDDGAAEELQAQESIKKNMIAWMKTSAGDQEQIADVEYAGVGVFW